MQTASIVSRTLAALFHHPNDSLAQAYNTVANAFPADFPNSHLADGDRCVDAGYPGTSSISTAAYMEYQSPQSAPKSHA